MRAFFRAAFALCFAMCLGATARAADSAAVSKLIDAQVQKRLDAKKIPASPVASDAEFLRRVYLDIAGVIPTAERVQAFLESKEPDKRAKVIEELLASPDYAKRMTDIWKGLLIPN